MMVIKAIIIHQTYVHMYIRGVWRRVSRAFKAFLSPSVFDKSLNSCFYLIWSAFETSTGHGFGTRRHHKKATLSYRHQHLISESILTILMFSKLEKNKLRMKTLSYYSEQCAETLFCPSLDRLWLTPRLLPHACTFHMWATLRQGWIRKDIFVNV